MQSPQDNLKVQISYLLNEIANYDIIIEKKAEELAKAKIYREHLKEDLKQYQDAIKILNTCICAS